MTQGKTRQTTTDGGMDRRAALARLGLGAAVAYTAPTVLHLDRSANATVEPSPCSNQGKGKGVPAWCRRRGR
jgi:hypothetical protein